MKLSPLHKPVKMEDQYPAHCLDLDLNGKRPGVISDTTISCHYSDNCYYHFFYFFWLSWYFVRFQEILFQTDSESFSFLSWKPKKFYCWKKKFLSRFQFKNKKALFTGAIFPKFLSVLFTDLNFDTLKHPTYSNLYRENPQNY